MIHKEKKSRNSHPRHPKSLHRGEKSSGSGQKYHLQDKCLVVKGKICLKCGRLGQLAKYCETETENASHQYRVKKGQPEEPVNNPIDSSSDIYPYLLCIEKDDNLHQLYPVKIGKTNIDTLIDSGSTLNII